MQSFIEKIIKNLNANGFPDKKVSFPLDTMYEKADDLGLNFNDVRIKLKEDHKIESILEGEKIIFSQIKSASIEEMLGNPDFMKKAQEMLKNMPEGELERMKQMYENMSEEERMNMMEKAKNMGLF